MGFPNVFSDAGGAGEVDVSARSDPMTGRRLLITGAGGFTGRHAVSSFAAAGSQVTAVLRHSGNGGGLGGVAPIFPEGVHVYYCDLSDRKAVHEMIQTVAPEEVLHLAGKNSVPESWRDPLLYIESNVMATLYLLEALRSLPQSRILVAGSRLKFKAGTAAGPPHPYSLSKTLEELASLAWGTLFRQPVLMAEPCNLIGPGPSTGFCSLLARYIVTLEAGGEPPLFKLSSRFDLRDFLDVRDAVRAYSVILNKGETGTVYKIDSGRQRSLGEIAQYLLSRSAVEVPLDWGPEAGESLEQSVMNRAQREDSRAAIPDHKETPEMNVDTLGWQPEIDLETSLTDILAYYRTGGEGGLV
ncbi:NAD-dependent epimerase/dehydratase family protein [Paenibacillus sp. GCM10012306]|uniref:NAD-dependent epimerase/dehydratase family protein n=1 Tax=Paenibacillus sp. GCM10012306 TaxID=3317342 RepID=UPI00360A9344